MLDVHAFTELNADTALLLARRRTGEPPGGALPAQDTTELLTAIADIEGKLARTGRLLAFAGSALSSPVYDR